MWKNDFNNLKTINDKLNQEFRGDYSCMEFNDNFLCKTKTYIEVKGIYPEMPINSTDIFIETWSCRFVNNVSWLYKQTATKYLIYRNLKGTYLIDYEKLRNMWFLFYPNPSIYNDEKIIEILEENRFNEDAVIGYRWTYNKTKQKNKSEGYWVPLDWFYKHNLIIKKY